MTDTQRRIVLPLITFALFLALCEAISRGFQIPTYLMPAPSQI